ncbi:MAG: O-antigen ligase family protein [Bacteroidales bacterium]|nr:O-antigen ligase family protein [Bacteroidales bacterium]
MLSRADKIFIALIGAGLMSIYVGAVSMYLWLGLMLVRLFMLNRVELGIFSLLFGSSLFGRMFASDQLVVVLTTGFLILGYILLRKEIVRTVVRNKVSWLVFGLLLFYFVVMYLLGPMNSYATGKIARLVVRGITWLLMFQIYVQSKNVNNNHFAILLGLLAIFYLSQSYLIYNVRPSGWFDVSFFREIAQGREAREAENFWANTHTLGYLATGAMVFLVMSEKIDIKSIWFLLFATTLLFVVITSGTRQVMIAFPLIIATRILIKDNKLLKNGLIAVVCVCVASLGILFSGSSAIEKSLQGSDVTETLNRDVSMPFEVIKVNPIIGVGFGGYPEYADKNYPHNLFLEIAAEFGVLGSIFMLAMVVVSVWASRISVRYKTVNGSYFILFLLLFLLKSIISGDLSSNVVLFAITLSFVNLQRHTQSILNVHAAAG